MLVTCELPLGAIPSRSFYSLLKYLLLPCPRLYSRKSGFSRATMNHTHGPLWHQAGWGWYYNEMVVSSRIFAMVLCYLTFAVSATIWISMKYLNDKGCSCREDSSLDLPPGSSLDDRGRNKRSQHPPIPAGKWPFRITVSTQWTTKAF